MIATWFQTDGAGLFILDCNILLITVYLIKQRSYNSKIDTSRPGKKANNSLVKGDISIKCEWKWIEINDQTKQAWNLTKIGDQICFTYLTSNANDIKCNMTETDFKSFYNQSNVTIFLKSTFNHSITCPDIQFI